MDNSDKILQYATVLLIALIFVFIVHTLDKIDYIINLLTKWGELNYEWKLQSYQNSIDNRASE